MWRQLVAALVAGDKPLIAERAMLYTYYWCAATLPLIEAPQLKAKGSILRRIMVLKSLFRDAISMQVAPQNASLQSYQEHIFRVLYG